MRSVFSVNLSGDADKTRAVFGFESYRDEYNWSTFEVLYRENEGMGSLQGEPLSRNKEFRNQFYAFAQFHWQVTARLKAQAGLTLNKTTYDFRDLFLGKGMTTAAGPGISIRS